MADQKYTPKGITPLPLISEEVLTQMLIPFINRFGMEPETVFNTALAQSRRYLAADAMYEALKEIENPEHHAPCRSGGIDADGVCPNVCVCKVGAALKLAEGGK